MAGVFGLEEEGWKMIQLRDYQLEGVTQIRGLYAKGYRRVGYCLSTGGGKTCCFSYITKSAYDKGSRVVLLCHRVEILDQISNTLTRAEVPHAVLKAGMKAPDDQVVVASIQTLARREMKEPDFIVVDEVHHVVSDTFTKVLERWPNAKVLGVSATFERLDGKPLRPWVDALVLGPRVTWLQAEGHLAKTEYWAPTTPDLKGVRKRMGDFDQGAIETLMATKKVTGDAIAEYQKHAPGRTAIAFCCSVKHAQEVAEGFTAAGIAAECIHGGTPDRLEMMERFRSGQTRVLTNCEILGEGVDVPVCGAAILLRPTASLGLHLQQIGRVLRPKPDGSKAVILDHAGNLMRHGGVEEVRDWNLDGFAKKRREKAMAMSQCKECFRVFVGTTCPSCGTEKQGNPRVVETTAGTLQAWNGQGPEPLTPEQKAKRERQINILIQVAKSKGHFNARSWAHAVVNRQEAKRREKAAQLAAMTPAIL
jgi:DNA repair protein RadD